MRETWRGEPSPLLPSLMVVGFGLILYWPGLLNIFDSLSTLFSYFILVLLVLLLLLLIHWLSLFFSIGKSSSYMKQHGTSVSSYDFEGFGFGFGSLIFFLLFLVLYNLLWAIFLLLFFPLWPCSVYIINQFHLVVAFTEKKRKTQHYSLVLEYIKKNSLHVRSLHYVHHSWKTSKKLFFNIYILYIYISIFLLIYFFTRNLK